MIDILAENPLLLLFAVAAVGYPLGRVQVAGGSLGVAAVLFAGLAFGALDPALKLPEYIYMLGLVLFVYTVGLSSGPGFFASLRGRGLRENLLALAMIATAAALTAAAQYALGLSPGLTAGLFAGNLTNTPALAGVLEHLQNAYPGAAPDRALSDPVVGYSMAYPVSVLTMILTVWAVQRRWRPDYAAEARQLGQPGAEELHSMTIRVTRPDGGGDTVADLMHRERWEVIFGRVQHQGQLALVRDDTRLAPGDLVSAVGAGPELARVAACLGEPSDERLEYDRSEFDYRRFFVSNPDVAGRRLRDLQLPRRLGAVVTRVRRGDVDILPHANTVLELGDRVRVVTRRENMGAVATFLGDSYRALAEIDILSFSLGLALGMLLGLVPIPLPGGITIRLGLAGGPLVVALVLGVLERTGPVVWTLPYGANLMLRQIGLIFFLAGVGTRAGHDFFRTLADGSGLALLAASAAIVAVTGLLTLWIGHRLLRVPVGVLIGTLAGIQTQPATLGFALEQARSDLPNLGYATVFPVASIVKIIVAQLLLVLLG